MIGIFDSGVGGLTVVKEIFKNLPSYQIIYFGDTARLPYGTKGANFVKKYSFKITKWLLENKARIIIIACHTSSAWASNLLKKKFKRVPIFEMITPAVNYILTKNYKKIGIIGTPGTIKSKNYEKAILKQNSAVKIYPKSCPLFVSLVEEGWVDKEITREVIKEYLSPLKKKKIEALVLACTHYPLLKKEIKRFLGKKIEIINPAEKLAKELELFLKKNPEIRKKIKIGKDHKFFFSDEPYNFQKISKLCFKKKLKIVVKDPFTS